MRIVTRFVLGLATACLAFTANAQNYPNKPIRVIVSIAAGSVTDVIMRAAAAELQGRLGQPLIIENVGGAAGILGGKNCAQAAPDGYNICVIYHSTLSFNPLLFSNLPYNAETDFVPVARLFFLVEGLFASSESNVKTVAEAKALAQSKPDGLNYATLGEGSYPELFLKWLNNQWNTQILGVPYRGGGPAAQALDLVVDLERLLAELERPHRHHVIGHFVHRVDIGHLYVTRRDRCVHRGEGGAWCFVGSASRRLQRRCGTSILLITHDLALAAGAAPGRGLHQPCGHAGVDHPRGLPRGDCPASAPRRGDPDPRPSGTGSASGGSVAGLDLRT